MADFSVNPSKDIPKNANNSGDDSASTDDQSMEDFYEQREWKKTLDALNPITPIAQAIGAINFVAQSIFGDSPAPAPAPAPAPTPKPTLTQRQIADLAMGGYDMSKEFRAAGITNAPTHTNFARE
jgi:prolipoprotein diacylglyceryltransferase